MKSHIELALTQIGVREIVGTRHNPTILNYFKEIGHKWVKTDETAWCSAFVNWVCKKSGLPFSGKLNAKSWKKVGRKVTKPKIGDVVVFWRENRNSWKGHVGFYISETATHIYVLGGNQGNMVCIKPYPKRRFEEYRRLI